MHSIVWTVRRTREAPGATRTKVLRPPSFWLGSQLGDGDRARSKSWCDRSAQADRTQQPSSSVASGVVLFFPSSPRPRSFEFVTLLNSMNDGLHEGNQPGTKPFIGYKPAFDCPSMHISCDPQDYLTFVVLGVSGLQAATFHGAGVMESSLPTAFQCACAGSSVDHRIKYVLIHCHTSRLAKDHIGMHGAAHARGARPERRFYQLGD